jgi:hypothetical protein
MIIKQQKTYEELNYLAYKLTITNWEKHIEYIIPKLSSTCFAMRTVTPQNRNFKIRLVYFHSIRHMELSFGEIQQAAK